jgi:hypothetical protein
MKGSPGNPFAKYITKVLTEHGYRDTYLRGKRCYYGLMWKGEERKDWNNPQALDIPVWKNNLDKFEFRSSAHMVIKPTDLPPVKTDD